MSLLMIVSKSIYLSRNIWMGLCAFILPISLVLIVRICVLYFIIIIKSAVWLICHCVGLGHETMVCAVSFYREKQIKWTDKIFLVDISNDFLFHRRASWNVLVFCRRKLIQSYVYLAVEKPSQKVILSGRYDREIQQTCPVPKMEGSTDIS